MLNRNRSPQYLANKVHEPSSSALMYGRCPVCGELTVCWGWQAEHDAKSMFNDLFYGECAACAARSPTGASVRVELKHVFGR